MDSFIVAEPRLHRKADNGKYYATKDFWDPVKKRRLLWGWAVPPCNAQTLAREVTWNPELQQLVYSPIEEQARLRRTQFVESASFQLAAGVPHPLERKWGNMWNQSEIVIVFP